MPKALKKYNIALDTNFIESQNFLAGSKLKNITDLVSNNTAVIHITDIVYKEVISRFKKRIKDSADNYDKPRKLLSSKVMILSPFPKYKSYFDLPDIDTVQLSADFISKFENWVKINKIVVLETKELKIGKIFDDYFLGKVPFTKENKKHEFPDAFTIMSLENYCELKKEKMFLITSDNDFLTYKSKWIEITKDESHVIDTIIRLRDHDKKVHRIEYAYSKSQMDFHKRMVKKIKDLCLTELDIYDRMNDFDLISIDHSDLKNTEFESFKILHLDEKYALIEQIIEFKLIIRFKARDYNEAYYDKEDDLYLFSEVNDYTINEVFSLPFTIKVKNMNDFKNLDLDDFALDKFNDGKSIGIYNYVKNA